MPILFLFFLASLPQSTEAAAATLLPVGPSAIKNSYASWGGPLSNKQADDDLDIEDILTFEQQSVLVVEKLEEEDADKQVTKQTIPKQPADRSGIFAPKKRNASVVTGIPEREVTITPDPTGLLSVGFSSTAAFLITFLVFHFFVTTPTCLLRRCHFGAKAFSSSAPAAASVEQEDDVGDWFHQSDSTEKEYSLAAATKQRGPKVRNLQVPRGGVRRHPATPQKLRPAAVPVFANKVPVVELCRAEEVLLEEDRDEEEKTMPVLYISDDGRFDDDPKAPHLSPPNSSIEQDYEDADNWLAAEHDWLDWLAAGRPGAGAPLPPSSVW